MITADDLEITESPNNPQPTGELVVVEGGGYRVQIHYGRNRARALVEKDGDRLDEVFFDGPQPSCKLAMKAIVEVLERRADLTPDTEAGLKSRGVYDRIQS